MIGNRTCDLSGLRTGRTFGTNRYGNPFKKNREHNLFLVCLRCSLFSHWTKTITCSFSFLVSFQQIEETSRSIFDRASLDDQQTLSYPKTKTKSCKRVVCASYDFFGFVKGAFYFPTTYINHHLRIIIYFFQVSSSKSKIWFWLPILLGQIGTVWFLYETRQDLGRESNAHQLPAQVPWPWSDIFDRQKHLALFKVIVFFWRRTII